jgi:hypothetical protein
MEFLLNFRKTLSRFWSPIPAVIALGVLSAYYFGITGTYWAVTGEFTRWGGHFLQLFGVDVSTWGYYKLMSIQGNIFTRVDGVMIIGMMYLVDELFRAKHKHFTVTIGEPIPWQTFDSSKSDLQWAHHVRKMVIALGEKTHSK